MEFLDILQRLLRKYVKIPVICNGICFYFVRLLISARNDVISTGDILQNLTLRSVLNEACIHILSLLSSYFLPHFYLTLPPANNLDL